MVTQLSQAHPLPVSYRPICDPVGSKCEPWTPQETYLVADYSGPSHGTSAVVEGWTQSWGLSEPLFPHQQAHFSSVILPVTIESSVKFGQLFHVHVYKLWHLAGTTNKIMSWGQSVGHLSPDNLALHSLLRMWYCIQKTQWAYTPSLSPGFCG